MSRVVALTGSVASGKSTVAAGLVRLGATLIDADALVHQLQRPGEQVHRAIAERFGANVIDQDGTLDRATLRRIVLGDPDSLRDLEAIVHPAVRLKQQELIEEYTRREDSLILVDIPLLFESGDPSAFERIIVVDAPREIRLRRLIEERGLDQREAELLMAAQLDPKIKRQGADLVIDNGGTIAELESSIAEAWEWLTE